MVVTSGDLHPAKAAMISGYAQSRVVPPPELAVLSSGVLILLGGLSVLLAFFAHTPDLGLTITGPLFHLGCARHRETALHPEVRATVADCSRGEQRLQDREVVAHVGGGAGVLQAVQALDHRPVRDLLSRVVAVDVDDRLADLADLADLAALGPVDQGAPFADGERASVDVHAGGPPPRGLRGLSR
jgi:hypothetical protein